MTKVCNRWGSAKVLWKNADWDWSQCQLIPTCVKWGDAGVIWSHANWLWSKCSGSFVPPTPPTASVIVQPPGVDATTIIQPWLIEPWNAHRTSSLKKKKFITLTCKIDGVEYDEKKEIGNFKLDVRDINLAMENIQNIDLNLKNDVININIIDYD